MPTPLTAEVARELGIRSFELMAHGDLADFAEIVHPEARNREAVSEPPASRGRGPAAIHATALWLRDAFAELAWEVHDAVADGDVVAMHTTMSGRHIRPFVVYGPDGAPAQAFAPTGKRFAVTQSHWYRVADDLLIEHWANRDDLGQASQLGWVPPSPVYLVRMRRALGRARRSHRRIEAAAPRA